MTISEKEWIELEDYRDSLEHYGVKGMKWGVRKQRETSGARRSSSKTKKKRTTISEKLRAKREKRAAAKVAKAKAAAEKKAKESKAKAEKEAAAKEKKRQANLRDPTKLYKHRSEYTQEEIQAALKQFEWEQKLSNYSKQRLDTGAQYIQTMFNYTNNAINLYNAAARIANSFGDDETMPYIKQIPGSDKKKDKDKK